MREVRAADLRGLLTAARDLAEIDDVDELRREAVRAVRLLVPCDSAVWAEGDPAMCRWTAAHDPVDAEPNEDADREYWTYRHQHPVGRYRRRTRDRAALRFSDVVPAREFRATELYNRFYRPRGVEHQLSIGIKLSPAWVVVVGSDRSRRDFSERDRAVLTLLQPHLIAAYRRARRVSARRLVEPSLTERETEVLAWVASGKTNPEIARRLSISPRTVQKHLEHVFEKLGVRTRTEAAMRWHASRRRREA